MTGKLIGIVVLVLLILAGYKQVQQRVIAPARVAMHQVDARLACAGSGDSCGVR